MAGRFGEDSANLNGGGWLGALRKLTWRGWEGLGFAKF